MWGHNYGHEFGAYFALAIQAIGALLVVAIWIAVLFFLVRFLLVATRAAQRYLALHPAPPAESESANPAPVPPTEPTAPAATAVITPDPAAPKTPAPRRRTPKA